ncbi:alpha/beta hydrolase [Clostridium felsineum]|uniref:alpha/beta hydrolase n=1 Tax=Clostridium felsineum TaxID=36839 RepID=UPI00098C1703|nr:alpha/beta hydrolase-fold protein [Clostridium felsineum]
MALVRVDFFSEKLMRTVTINAIVPIDKMTFEGMQVREKKPFKTLYLLNGMFGNYTDWVAGTRIQAWAQERNLVVIMPSGENKFYVDNINSGDLFGQFIGEELVEKTRDLFPLSTKREDTYIGGLSMGGYGSLVNGLKYHETFSHICALSPALILDMVLNSSNNAEMPVFRRCYFETIFGNIDELIGSDKDYKALITKLIEEKVELPKIWISCGTEDTSLINQTRDYRDFLRDNNVEFTYVEGPGAHDWEFWDLHILKAMDWLPLENITKSIHSGNVGK